MIFPNVRVTSLSHLFNTRNNVSSMSLWCRERIKKPLAILGIAAVLLQVNTVGFYLLLYHMNADTLSQTVCEKRVPACHAKCFLRKELSKASNREDNGTAAEKHTASVLNISVEYLPHIEQHHYRAATSVLSFYFSDSKPLNGYHNSVFNPPRFL